MSTGRRDWSVIVPAEIWLDIFNCATWIPGALDLSDHGAIALFTTQDSYSRHDVIQSAIQVNLSISLVCRAWHPLTQEFMFRYISIESGDQVERLEGLLQGFDCHPRRNSSPCRWTRRLEISVPNWSPWTSLHTASLLSVRKRCSNLAIFSTAFCQAQSCCFCGNVGHILQHICADSCLRRLELKDSQLTDLSLFNILGPSLEILFIGHSPTASPTAKRLAPRLPKLHTLVTGFAVSCGQMMEWQMPSLRALSVDNESGLKSFLARVGPHLRFLVLHNPYLLVPSLVRCPQLYQVDIEFHDIQPGDAEHPFVTHLADAKKHTSIRSIILRNLVSRRAYQLNDLQHRIADILYHISGATFPALASICLIPFLDVGAIQLGFREVLGAWISSCENRGIRVQHGHYGDSSATWQQLTVGCSGVVTSD